MMMFVRICNTSLFKYCSSNFSEELVIHHMFLLIHLKFPDHNELIKWIAFHDLIA